MKVPGAKPSPCRSRADSGFFSPQNMRDDPVLEPLKLERPSEGDRLEGGLGTWAARECRSFGGRFLPRGDTPNRHETDVSPIGAILVFSHFGSKSSFIYLSL